MFKAMALICAAWISNGQAQQACFTHMFDWEFETKRECQMRLIYYRAKELPHYHNIVLGECIKVNKLQDYYDTTNGNVYTEKRVDTT